MLEEAPQDDAWAWEAVARQAAYRYSKSAAGDVDQKLVENILHLERALELAEGKDRLLEVLLLQKLSIRYRDVFEYHKSLAAAARMLDVLDGADPSQPSVLHRLVGRHGVLRPLPEALASYRVQAHARAQVAARNLRDYDLSAAHSDFQVEAAEALVETQPNLLASALGERAALARTMGDISCNDVCLRRQRKLAEERPWWLTDSIVQRSMANEAEFFADYDTARRCELERLQTRVAGEGFPLESATPANTEAIVRQLHDANYQQLLTSIGNATYNLAANLLQSRRCNVDPCARAEARQWLDVAEESWRDIAMNGLYAVGFRRLQLDILDGQAPPPLEVGRKMIALSRQWRRPGGQLRAALMATVEGAPGDLVVLDRLRELQQGAPAIDIAHLNVGVAGWSLRAGDAALGEGDAVGAAEHWQRAIAAGAKAADGLAIPRPGQSPVLLNAQRHIDALTIQADAQHQLRHHRGSGLQGSAPTAEEELSTRLRSLPAVARRVSASGTPVQRRATADLYARPLSVAIELAVELRDFDAVDAICEVVRRDAAGAILASMARDPNTPEKVAELARKLTAALQASIDAGSEEPDMPGSPESASTITDGDGGENPPLFDLGQRAATIEDQLAGALDVMGTVVGPVARAIFDPNDVTSSTAGRLLGQPSSPQAVLSLWLRPDNHLFRHLAWRTEHGVEHAVDDVSAPDWLGGLTAADAEPDNLMAALDNLSAVLFPAELLHVLTTHDPDHPLDLTIVPTGLLGLPFAAVPVTRQYLLVDLATIAIVQSLTAAHALAQGIGHGPATKSVGAALAVYDPGLTYAEQEFQDLLKHHREVHRVASLEDLATELSIDREPGRTAMFVLALHGLRGGDGWSQTKLLPTGQLLRTAHILEWQIPTLVVGASCDTDIREDNGGDLGGFPLAFQMKGARLVIGTLTKVDDQATAEIMGLFYAGVAAQLSPARALRHAQRTYFSVLDRKSERHLWAFHIAYGYSDSQSPPST